MVDLLRRSDMQIRKDMYGELLARTESRLQLTLKRPRVYTKRFVPEDPS